MKTNKVLKEHKIKIILSLITLLGSNTIISQTSVKANFSSLIGYPQIGAEITLGKKTTFQIDGLTSIWKSIKSGPNEIYMVIPEFRYYPKKAKEGFYAGLHIGGAKYNLKKWNYLSLDWRQKGYSLFYGGTIGYEYKLNDKFSLDFFLGGGNQQGFYKGYDSNGNRYEDVKNYNKSGEWLIYRGGIMLAYKL